MRIGVLGAGQLGRMLALAGLPLGLEFVFLGSERTAPAAACGRLIQGRLDDPEALGELAACTDLVTYEFENIPVTALRAAALEAHLAPPLGALATAQDRLAEKRLFEQLDIPTAAYAVVDSRVDLPAAAAAVGLPAVLKARRLGYDGRGQVFVNAVTELEGAWETLGGVPAILEQYVRFERELSLIVAASGTQLRYYPLAENLHRDGILVTTLAPIQHADCEDQARAWLRALVRHFDYRGVLTVEFFATKGGLMANEMAPRVHNSGHWTIEGAGTSQFENHLRAILGWPLGDTACRGAAAMLNLLGTLPEPDRLLAIPGAHYHSYGKAPRPGRKLGHCTILAADLDAARARLADARQLIGQG